MVIVCGWCGRPTANEDRCTSCGHTGPRVPWEQRAQPVPAADQREPGRPRLTDAEMQRRLASGGTDDDIAERFDVDPRTVRRWRAKVSG